MSLRKEHFNVAKALEDVTDEMEECIDCILRCMNVIMWLREELKGEIMRFVDFDFSMAIDIVGVMDSWEPLPFCQQNVNLAFFQDERIAWNLKLN